MISDELQSKIISQLRFPLMVGVVLIHSTYTSSVFQAPSLAGLDFPWYDNLSYLISQIMAKTAVPLFFLFSGFLFFWKVENFTPQVYLQKLKRRVHSLLIPYLIWNLLIFILSYVRQHYFGGLSQSHLDLTQYGWGDFLQAFWATTPGEDGRPIGFQFWFLRDLMVIMVLTPLFYLGVRYLKLFFVAFFGIFWFIDFWWDVPGVSVMGFFFFSLGAYLSLNHQNFLVLKKGRLIGSCILYAVIAAAMLFLKESEKDTSLFLYLQQTSILIGVVIILSFTAIAVEKSKWHLPSLLSRSSFFLYAYHGLAISWVLKFALVLFHPVTDAAFLGIYLLSPTLVIVLGVGIYYVLQRFLPKLTSILVGNR